MSRGGGTLVLLGLLTVAPGAPSPVDAQAPPASLTAEARFQSYSFDEESAAGLETLALTTVRFSAVAPLGRVFSLGVNGAWGQGTMNRVGGAEFDVSGLTDTQVSLTWSPDAFFDLSAIVLLSTGDETQTLQESFVAGALASDLFPFLVSTWGNGGGVGGNASVAYPLGPVGAGLAVAYVTGRDFEPLAGQAFAYRPGDLLRVVAALDATVGEASKASMRVTWHHYGEDELDGNNLFRSGDRLQALGSLAFPVGAGSSGLAYAGVTHREHGTFGDELLIALGEELPSENLILVGGGVRIGMGGVVVQPDAELRVLRRSDGRGQGYDVGVGGRVEFDAGGLMLAPAARVHFGELEVREGEAGGLVGFEIGVTAGLGGGR